MISLVVILVIIVGLGLFVMSLYNALVRGRNEVKSAWSSIDVQLKRRYDLIPNLIETVKVMRATSGRRLRLSSRPGSKRSASQEAWRIGRK